MNTFMIRLDDQGRQAKRRQFLVASACWLDMPAGIIGGSLALCRRALLMPLATLRALITFAVLALAIAVPNAGVEPATLNREQRRFAKAIARRRYFVIVLEQKGGVGKSLMLQIVFEVISGNNEKVRVLDADEVNLNIRSIDITQVGNIVRADAIDFEGFLFDASRQLCDGIVDAVVVDSAAGNEKYFHRHLPEIAKEVCGAGGRLIVIRPVTTNPITRKILSSLGGLR